MKNRNQILALIIVRNLDGQHTKAEVLAILTTFAQKLIDSGYNVVSREEVMKAGIRKHYRDVAKA